MADPAMPREITDKDGITWSCIQAGLFNALSERGGASGAVKDVFALSERRPV